MSLFLNYEVKSIIEKALRDGLSTIVSGESQECHCKHEKFWVSFPLAEIKYVIFSIIPRSGNKAKRGVEFHHSTCNDSRIRRKVGKVRKCLNRNGFSKH